MAHDVEKTYRLIQRIRDREFDPQGDMKDALKLQERLQQHRNAGAMPQPSATGSAINGPTYAKLEAALIAFPAKYGNMKPKLDADVRPWLKHQFECSAREAYVFGAILAEHFGIDRRSR